MSRQLAVVGAGGFGRETIDVVRAINAASAAPVWELIGVVDDAPSDANLGRLHDLGVRFIGSLDQLADIPGVRAAVGVGATAARRAIVEALTSRGIDAPDLVHPTAVLGGSFRSRGGLVACAHVSVGTNVSLGRHVHLNPHAVIGHDTDVDDFVSINPNATISGDCILEPGAYIGASALVLQGLRVGSNATVGGAACVVRNVPAGAVVKGVPAR